MKIMYRGNVNFDLDAFDPSEVLEEFISPDMADMFEDMGLAFGSMAGGFLAGLLAVLLFILVIFIAFYVFKSIVLFKVAKRRGVENAWLAWIPYGDMWTLGKACGPMAVFGKWNVAKPELILLLAPIALWLICTILGFFGLIPVVGLLVAAASTLISWVGQIVIRIFRSLALYRIYSVYHKKSTTLAFAIIDFFFSVTQPFFLASTLKREPISEGYDLTF